MQLSSKDVVVVLLHFAILTIPCPFSTSKVIHATLSFQVAATMLMEMFFGSEVPWQLSLLVFEFEIRSLQVE